MTAKTKRACLVQNSFYAGWFAFLVVVVDSESLEVLFDSLDLTGIKDVLMSAYHRSGAGRPAFNPLGLFRFKIVLSLKSYRSQRALERELNVDVRVRGLCGFDEDVPSHSTIVRFERRVGVERLGQLVGRVVEDLVNCGFIKGLKVVLDSKPLRLGVGGIRRTPQEDGLTTRLDWAGVLGA